MSTTPENKQYVWGEAPTEFFYSLTPDRILDAVENLGYRCSGRYLALNSMENRVYEIELDHDEDPRKARSRYELYVIAKFYRPGRWTKKQIQDEHDFLAQAEEDDVPVVVPLSNSSGETVFQLQPENLYYSIFPKVGGRIKDELNYDEFEQLGRLIARLHLSGARKPANHRLTLDVETFGAANLNFLLEKGLLPLEIRKDYERTANYIFDQSRPLWKKYTPQRIHGDCHMGNLLWGTQNLFFVDFDDMAMGFPVQDLWLITGGTDEIGLRERESLLCGYESMKDFDRGSLKLIEPLRALRFIHFSAWIGKRFEDPSFKKVFTTYGSIQYWHQQLQYLKEQEQEIRLLMES